ncbi:transglycosylase SLT domain-containing protein [Pseudoduganella namucuonensis]|uniref:Membrane-bound lytic murein transglycosylase D n=1 Tax=Pseudoduganella namucuonensis TaxID=1035707 RepID=A0A1I7M4K8_9BURK|nr:transglycosylase SLT domain-containing protein [Pseudoduganella namucuonensis]SFV16874.1 membrane-bound lytic murein transglycosylase D [Pseudoduganella namucuonensis]
MQARYKYSPMLAALLLAPAISQALDSAPATLSGTPLTAPAATKLPIAELLAPKAAAKPAPGVVLNEDAFRETDVWGRIRTGYAIPDLNNELVQKHVAWHAARPDHMARTGARASRYLFYVVTELEKRGMPTELALLPFIESAFNPQALSSANAAGMWQFVPGTGRDYNLKQNAFKDDRRSVMASTDAALSYLQRLYDMFGDWQLALAAYNWGEGNVQKAVKRNQAAGKPIDFDTLSQQMPAETRNYVPKLQAVKNIVANPAQYALHLPAIDNSPYFTAIDKTSDIDLTVAAQLAELSVDEFKALNPQFNRPVIVGGEQTQILLPKENAEKFNLNLAQWGRALSSWTVHKITSARERIDTLAKRFQTTPEVIRQANNIPQKSVLKAGSTILVPKTSSSLNLNITPEIADNATVSFEADRGAGKSRYQRAKGGDVKDAPVALVKARVSRDAAGKKSKQN